MGRQSNSRCHLGKLLCPILLIVFVFVTFEQFGPPKYAILLSSPYSKDNRREDLANEGDDPLPESGVATWQSLRRINSGGKASSVDLFMSSSTDSMKEISKTFINGSVDELVTFSGSDVNRQESQVLIDDESKNEKNYDKEDDVQRNVEFLSVALSSPNYTNRMDHQRNSSSMDVFLSSNSKSTAENSVYLVSDSMDEHNSPSNANDVGLESISSFDSFEGDNEYEEVEEEQDVDNGDVEFTLEPAVDESNYTSNVINEENGLASSMNSLRNSLEENPEAFKNSSGNKNVESPGANAIEMEARNDDQDASGTEKDYQSEVVVNETVEVLSEPAVDESSSGINHEGDSTSTNLLAKSNASSREEFSENGINHHPPAHSFSLNETAFASVGVQWNSDSLFISPPKLDAKTNVSYSALDKGVTEGSDVNQNSELKGNGTTLPPFHRKVKKIPKSMTISEINTLLLHRQFRSRSVKPRWSSPVDRELREAKSLILNAPVSSSDPSLYAPLYRNLSMFSRSYELMEKMLKVYVYSEGAKPIMHQPFLNGIYASEGWFMKLIESSKQFVTKKPQEAHLFYLPFSSRNMADKLRVNYSHGSKNLKYYLNEYLDVVAKKHAFWNRTYGTDHFFVACHDWAPKVTEKNMVKCIRSLCNANVIERFSLGKDVSLPQAHVRWPKNLLRDVGGKPASQRSILAFFAGNMHGYLRPILLQHWGEGKDPDMKIFGRMPKASNGASSYQNYINHMKSSKYCICARGYGVNSPRVVESIFYECVPVIISDNYVPPLFSILNWESFGVFVPEKDIPNLKSILLQIPRERYIQLQMGVKRVKQHFLWHSQPLKYDLFHMILNSIWFSRILRA